MTASRSKKVATLALFLALAMILSYVEAIVPIPIPVPGIKLGLANSAVLIILLLEKPGDALLVSLVRIFLSGLLFGNAFSIIYSLSGGILSFVIMFLAIKLIKLHPVTASILGGVFHNIGQVIAACFILGTKAMLYYIPVLLVSGIITGALIGIISNEIHKRIGGKILI